MTKLYKNRTIKFRAWLGGVMHPKWLRIDMDVYKDHPGIVIMQYTGLKDKNGKEIYEGDIIISASVAVKIKPTVIEWDDIYSGYDIFTDPESILGSNDYEVIGNIYENPELL